MNIFILIYQRSTSWSLFIVNRLMFQSKLFVFFVLLNIFRGSYETPYQNRKISQLSKPRVPDYDNRYVWFTRNIHDEDNNHNRREILLKKLNNIFYRKNSNRKLNQV
jgi:hypothetical protein